MSKKQGIALLPDNKQVTEFHASVIRALPRNLDRAAIQRLINSPMILKRLLSKSLSPKEMPLPAPRLGKRDVRRLLEMIAGGEKELTVDQFHQWEGLIRYAVASMRSAYEGPNRDPYYPVAVYYRSDFQAIDGAGKDREKMVKALEHLRVSIEWE